MLRVPRMCLHAHKVGQKPDWNPINHTINFLNKAVRCEFQISVKICKLYFLLLYYNIVLITICGCSVIIRFCASKSRLFFRSRR